MAILAFLVSGLVASTFSAETGCRHPCPSDLKDRHCSVIAFSCPRDLDVWCEEAWPAQDFDDPYIKQRNACKAGDDYYCGTGGCKCNAFECKCEICAYWGGELANKTSSASLAQLSPKTVAEIKPHAIEEVDVGSFLQEEVHEL
eukprot:TRINITY_DN10588_c0_g1_i2.p1 TRINITY_DN10588_c0_g1~~TRINITY_DN10588_c0_g1_i2.p1  ORF type:complete len:159 (+),score=29.53 TRINITY_DN10588_c0_g1_i2:46-477(+)